MNWIKFAFIVIILISVNATYAFEQLFESMITYYADDNPGSVFAVDLNGDGFKDLVATYAGSDKISIMQNNGNGTFQDPAYYGVGSSPISLFAEDLDDDGDCDLAVANNASNNVSILINNGDGTLQPAVNYGAGRGVYSVFSFDLDGDGDNDVGTGNYLSHNISILKNINGEAYDCIYVVGDANHSSNYNGLDITYGVSFLKGGLQPICPYCSLCSGWYYCGDVNGSCSYNGLDITYGVAYLKGGNPPQPCPDCPPAGP
jgi:hypothetical protein